MCKYIINVIGNVSEIVGDRVANSNWVYGTKEPNSADISKSIKNYIFLYVRISMPKSIRPNQKQKSNTTNTNGTKTNQIRSASPEIRKPKNL